MSWYSWIGTGLMVIGGIAWYIMPDKTLLYHVVTIGMVVIGFCMIKFIPDKKLE